MYSTSSVASTVLWSALLFGCSNELQDRFMDGGGFRLPDAGPKDMGVSRDSGPFVCDPLCSGTDVCGCLDGTPVDCGCHPPGQFGQSCDPERADTCAAPLACVPTRQIDTSYRCSDGRLHAPCSHADDICTSVLGCLCLTQPTGQTTCSCEDATESDPVLCDRMVSASCASSKVCVRAVGAGGQAYFVCSDGSEGSPCEPDDGSCTTSLGCTCPTIFGAVVCSCSEPGDMGDPCDQSVSGSCVEPLVCNLRFDPENGSSTICEP